MDLATGEFSKYADLYQPRIYSGPIMEGKLVLENKFLSFSNTMRIILENIDTKEKEQYEFKHLKKIGMYRGNLNPEDLVLTNSFESFKNKSMICENLYLLGRLI